jgi:hydroxymethylpyrimidine pyrophosphatase-like HAD family hydrolase
VVSGWGSQDTHLIDLARASKADLIVVGTNQRRGLDRFWLGSVSRGILHHASTNVVCVPMPDEANRPNEDAAAFKRVLVPTDFSKLGNKAIAYAYGAAQRGGRVSLVHVIPPVGGFKSDGTIAEGGKAHPAVLAALQEARTRGIVVVLVTGRSHSDLRKVAGDLGIFDAVVAENGAVLAFPNGRTRVLGRPPPASLLDELCRLKVDFEVGECVLEADASAAPRILAAVQKLELPLVLVFNRSRVMLLPQGVSKATGLRTALDTLRLSLHNCIAIGDAENDYQLLEASEVGVAVAWGRKSLFEIADDVLPGQGPAAVADYIRKVMANTRLPPHRADRRRVLLGQTEDGHPLEMAVHGRIILVAGDPRSGKSWVTGLFCEQLILQGYCLCVIDPEGDYGPLEALPGVVVLGGDEPLPRLSDVARALRYPDISVVINLSQSTHSEKVEYLSALLPMLAELRRNTGQPHWIVVDEAHYFLPEPNFRQRVDIELAGYMLVTHRVSNLPPDLLKEVESIIVTQITDPREAQALTTIYGRVGEEAEWESLLNGLTINEAAFLPKMDAPERKLQRFNVAGRMTPHVRHRSKYLEVPMLEHHAFVFTYNGHTIGRSARTLKEFVTMMARLPVASIDEHTRQNDFSRWIADVFGDQPLAAELRKVEQQYQRGQVPNLVEALIAPIRQRYELIGVGLRAG